MKRPRFWFSDARNQLVLDTPIGLNSLQIKNACDYALNVYTQKYKNYPAGDRRDIVLKGIKAINEGRVVQRVVGRNDFEIDRIIVGA